MKEGDLTADIKWIKITTDVFDNKKIKQIEDLPEADTIIVIWFKLLCLAGTCNADGMVYFTPDIPYTDQMLARHFNRPLKTIQLALHVFQQYHMIETVDNFLYISSWAKYQNIDGMEKIREQNRLRVERFRNNRKLLKSNVTGNVTVTQSNATDIEEDIEEEKEGDTPSKEGVCAKKPRKQFIPPTLDEVKQYCRERNSTVDPVKFFDYYSVGQWKDSKGNPVRNWKQKLLTWELKDTGKKPEKKTNNIFLEMLEEENGQNTDNFDPFGS